MPAFLIKVLYSTISFSILFLVGCSRDNPLNTPDDYVEPEALLCEAPLPIDPILIDLAITETTLSYTVEDEQNQLNTFEHFNADAYNYQAQIDHLIHEIEITPTTITIEPEPEPDPAAPETETIATTKLTSIDVSINNEQLESLNQTKVINLLEGSTEVNILVKAKYSTPVSIQDGTACAPVYVKDPTGKVSSIQETEEKLRTLNYTIIILRSQFDELTMTTLELPQDTSELGDEFGGTVNLGSTSSTGSIVAVVGVPNKRIDDSDSGATYLYEQTSIGDWSEPTLLTAGNPDPGDMFGYSVSLSNGLLAVSAPSEDSSSPGIFPWIDLEGALDEEGNPIPDGINDNNFIEINDTAQSSGAVYVYKKDESSSNTWNQLAFIKQPSIIQGLSNYDIGFGKNVLLQDGILVISAPQQINSVAIKQDDEDEDPVFEDLNSGTVYVYKIDLDTDIISLAATLVSSTASEGGNFGAALSIHDGSILIGAPGEDNGKGSAHLFKQSSNTWELDRVFTASNANEGDAFGTSVAFNSTKLFVGAKNEDSAGKSLNRDKNDNSLKDSGAVYGYSLDEFEDAESAWTEFVYIKAPEPLQEAQFGKEIKFEDYNLIISEPFRSNTNSTGQAYLYELNDKALQLNSTFLFESIEPSITAENEQLNARFGSKLSLFNNIIAIGANGFTNRESGIDKTHSGKAYIFQ